MNRICHPWHLWECYKSGFYDDNNLSKDENEAIYMEYFHNTTKFKRDMKSLVGSWKYSSEHFLLNPTINRVAWIGQACVFRSKGVPRKYKYSYNLLPQDIQSLNNKAAKEFINEFQKEYTKKLHQQVEMLGVFL